VEPHERHLAEQAGAALRHERDELARNEEPELRV
jgi:hypothetical protein